MKYIRFYGDNGYAGCDWEEFAAVDDETEECELDDRASDLANDWAESYENVAEGYDDGGWESEEAENEYYEGVWGSWKEISKEEYRDGLAN